MLRGGPKSFDEPRLEEAGVAMSWSIFICGELRAKPLYSGRLMVGVRIEAR